MVLKLTFLIGLFQVRLGLARLGSLVNFVSHSVILGFTAGAAIRIATSQMQHLKGSKLRKGHYFVHIWTELIPRLSEANLYVLAVALITLLIALLFKKLLPNWPGMLVAMIGGSILALLLDGKNLGVQLFVNHQIPGTCNIGNFQVYPANP
jgi:SulP family sulfate permease